MAGLPFLKLAGLFVKTISKPVATRMKTSAGRHPNLSLLCVWLGETSHQFMSRMNVMASGYKFVGAKPLPAEEALKQGIDVLSEAIVFFVAGSIMTFEYNRSETEKAIKAKKQAFRESEEKAQLESRFVAIERQVDLILRDIEHIQKQKEKEESSKEAQRSHRNWLGFSFR